MELDDKITAAREFVKYGDGFADITLDKGIKLDGATVKSLRMREPTVRDNRAAGKVVGDNADVEVTLFANLCNVTPDDMNDMTQRDYTRVQAAYTGFTD